LFECIKRDEGYWSGNRFIIKTPDIYGGKSYNMPSRPIYSTRDLTLFRDIHSQERNLYDAAYHNYLYEGVKGMESVPDKDLRIKGETWAEIVYRLLFKYWFVPGAHRDDILSALTFAFSGRVTSLIESIHSAEEQLAGTKNVDINFIVSSVVTAAKDEQRKDFLRLRETFALLWKQKHLETKPPIIPAHALEFIPGVPTVLPKRIAGRGGKVVSS
jgi:hypothetical protein